MKLIKTIIEKAALAEDAAGGAVGGGASGAVGAHAVASLAMPLFSQLTARDHPKKIRIVKPPKKKKQPRKGLGIKEEFYSLVEDQSQIGGDTFDTSEVMSKLKSLENKETISKYETQAFALEDEDGNMVKVRVRTDQAPSFEAALNAFLADIDDDNEGRKGVPEIAELLFKLKDRYDIVDVEWPDVPEDQEEDVSLQGGENQPEQALGGEDGEGGAEGGMGAGEADQLDLGDAGADMGAGGGEEDVKGLLTQVIDMMKADAEARRAEAHARTAEAKAKEADSAKDQVYAKVKQEEQILDMEAHEKQQSSTDKEAKRLAKLARWKHDMEQDEGTSFEETPEFDVGSITGDLKGGREEEESHRTSMRHPGPMKAQSGRKEPRLGGRVAPADVAKFILSRVK